MGRAVDLARLLNSSGLVPLNNKAAGVLPDANAPIGSVLQAVQAVFTGTQTIAASGYSNWTDVTNLSLSITPLASSSKILLIAQISLMPAADRIVNARFTGGNAGNFVGDAAGIRSRAGGYFVSPGNGANGGVIVMNYIDSPATASAVNYKVQVAPNFNSGNVAINYNSVNDANDGYITRSASSLIALEIAG